MAHIDLFCAIKSVLTSSWWLPLEMGYGWN